jgi:hypothetical protein
MQSYRDLVVSRGSNYSRHGVRYYAGSAKQPVLSVERYAGDIWWVMNLMRQGIVAAQFWLLQVR